MRQWKRVLSAGLAASLLAGLLTVGASAAQFTKTKTYQSGQFTDVAANAWFVNDVMACYELGLMSGANATTFNPGGMFTLAESATIAARLHHIYNGGDGTIPAAAGAWYQGAVQYCREKKILSATEFDGEFGRSATRAEMAYLLCNALPGDAFPSKNALTRLPDVTQGTPYSQAIITFYQAGIFTGSDAYGTFQPYANITRAEVAAIVARVAQPATRKVLALKDPSQREAPVLLDVNVYTTVSNGRIRFRDPTTKLYGYQDTNGSVVIPAQYKYAEAFSGGYAKVENGKYGLIDVNGKVAVPLEYDNIDSRSDYPSGVYYVTKGDLCGLAANGKVTIQPVYLQLPDYANGNYRVGGDGKYGGVYGIVTAGGKTIVPVKDYSFSTFNGIYGIGSGKDSTDVYDKEGKLLTSYAARYTSYTPGSSLNCAYNSNLLAVKVGNKWALATGTGYVTEAIYDDITLTDNSDLAIVKYGDLEGLAGLNGEIIAPGTYSKYVVDGAYAACLGEGTIVVAQNYGVVAESASFKDYSLNLEARDGYVLAGNGYEGYGGVFIDKNGQPLEVAETNCDRMSWRITGDGEYALCNGVVYGPYADIAHDYHYYKASEVSYGVWDDEKGPVTEAIFATYSEVKNAWEQNSAPKEYSIQKNAAGKPYVGYGNQYVGYESVIEFYKNNIYYDEISSVGEGYYACRYNTTWYLVHE